MTMALGEREPVCEGTEAADYGETDPQHMILRDCLARDRTLLVNVCTAIALQTAGGDPLKILRRSTLIEAARVLLLMFGAVMAALDIRRFRVAARACAGCAMVRA